MDLRNPMKFYNFFILINKMKIIKYLMIDKKRLDNAEIKVIEGDLK